MIHHIDYERLGCGRSRFDKIFLSLSSEFESLSGIHEAEALIQRSIDESAAAYARGAAGNLAENFG